MSNHRKEAIYLYYWVKENIKYSSPSHCCTVDETIKSGRGNCLTKSEVLVSKLRSAGIEARYVEGRKMGKPRTFALWLALKLGLVILDCHIWVEALVNGEWLTLDPSPDSGIAHCLGDTKPGTHLGKPGYVLKWVKLPLWYKEGYNMKLLCPLKLIGDLEIRLRRHSRR